ncbi:MAG: hypothetical protein MJ147_04000 [Clostridia bacterium]|nr:hypothetical protein [Clostridia bacterium]
MKRKKQKNDVKKNFPIVADMLGVWEEYADEDDAVDVLGSYTGNPQDDDLYPEQDADDL